MYDSYGDTCSSWYDDYGPDGEYFPGDCGCCDTADFTANVLCCACGGDISKYSF